MKLTVRNRQPRNLGSKRRERNTKDQGYRGIILILSEIWLLNFVTSSFESATSVVSISFCG